MNAPRPLRVLVVDDSVLHRQTISELLKGAEDIEVVGKAANGEEALRMVGLVNPDLITLDLEMPRMDGFTFLRILMSRQPMPVIVISSQSQRENVFKALELGALDFVARPTGGPGELASVRAELLAKVGVVRALRPASRIAPLRPVTGGRPLTPNPSMPAPLAQQPPAAVTGGYPTAVTGGYPTAAVTGGFPATPSTGQRPPKRLVVIASSTGGPQALLDLAGRLLATSGLGVVIAQHMPERFTRTFAERLHRRAALRVAEGEDGSVVEAGTIWICPGGKSTEVEAPEAPGLPPRLRVTPPKPSDRYVPSADRIFKTAAAAYGAKVTAVVITGMGDDGVVGLPYIKRAGGEVWVEAGESAVVDGMPAAARKTGLADAVMPLGALIARLVAL